MTLDASRPLSAPPADNTMRVFVKHHGASAEEDWKRVNQLHLICEQLEGVVAPRPIFIDSTHQTIGYQYLDGLSPLTCRRGNEDLFFRVGCDLARMHAQGFHRASDVEEHHLRPLPLEQFGLSRTAISLLSDLPCGFFHGDLWHGNLFHRSDGELVVIDPIPPHFLFRGSSFVACGAIDLATLHMSLYIRTRLSRYFADIPNEVDEHAHALLAGYLETCGANNVTRQIEAVSLALSQRWISQLDIRLSWPVAYLKRRMSQRAIQPLRKRHGLV